MKHLLFACALLGLTACTEVTGGFTLPPGVTPIGTFNLVSLNGEVLPVVVGLTGDETREVLSATLTMTGSGDVGSASSEKEIRVTVSGQNPTTVTETRTGVWTLAGTNIALEWEDSCTEAYSLSLNTLVGSDCDFDMLAIWERD